MKKKIVLLCLLYSMFLLQGCFWGVRGGHRGGYDHHDGGGDHRGGDDHDHH